MRQKSGRVWKIQASDLRIIVKGKQRRASKYIPKARIVTKIPHVHGLNINVLSQATTKEVKNLQNTCNKCAQR